MSDAAETVVRAQDFLASIDEPVVYFVAGVVAEGIADGQIRSRADLDDVLLQSLVDYAIADNEEEAERMVVTLFEALQAAQLVSDAADASMSRKAARIASLKPGTRVSAQYSGDDAWYEARIDAVLDEQEGRFFVWYLDYDEGEERELCHIREKKVSVAADTDKSDKDKIASIADTVSANTNTRVEERIKNLTLAVRPETSVQDLEVAKSALTSKQRKRQRELERRMKLLERYDPSKFHGSKMEQKVLEAHLRAFLDPANAAASKRIDLHDLNMYSPDNSKLLLSNFSLTLNEGCCYGLIGKNGAGKSTLLRMMSRYDLDGFPKHVRVLHVEQEIHGDDMPVLEFVLSRDHVREHLLKQQAMLQEKQSTQSGRWTERDEEKLRDVEDKIEELEVHTAEQRARKVLSGLGFSERMLHEPIKSLSGGWRMRASLASALFIQPDLLLLDEPTNHLDFPAVLWLENFLKTYEKTAVVVSHDREFLNNVINNVVLLNQMELQYFNGDFQQYERTRAEQLRCQRKAFEAQQRQIAKIKEFIEKFRFNAKRASLVQSRIKELARMEKLTDVGFDAIMKFTIPSPPAASENEATRPVFLLDNVSFSWSPETDEKLGRPPLLQNVTLAVGQEARIGVMGPNGVGKSTLLKLMIGDLMPTAGDSFRDRQARVAFFTQHHVEQIDLTKTALDFLMEEFADEPELKASTKKAQFVRQRLGRFGINDDVALRPMYTLSGGQKSRVALCMQTWIVPNCLVLDEPTNHLDLETCDALIDALRGYKGAILVVSHDQHFLRHVANEFWVVTSTGVARFDSFDSTKAYAAKQSLKTLD